MSSGIVLNMFYKNCKMESVWGRELVHCERLRWLIFPLLRYKSVVNPLKSLLLHWCKINLNERRIRPGILFVIWRWRGCLNGSWALGKIWPTADADTFTGFWSVPQNITFLRERKRFRIFHLKQWQQSRIISCALGTKLCAYISLVSN